MSKIAGKGESIFVEDGEMRARMVQCSSLSATFWRFKAFKIVLETIVGA
mgnify:CR=1 FL=1